MRQQTWNWISTIVSVSHKHYPFTDSEILTKLNHKDIKSSLKDVTSTNSEFYVNNIDLLIIFSSLPFYMLDPHQSKEELEKLLSVLEEENRVKAYLVIFHIVLSAWDPVNDRLWGFIQGSCVQNFKFHFSPSSLCFVFIHDALELIN